jgi:hypothetical protein
MLSGTQTPDHYARLSGSGFANPPTTQGALLLDICIGLRDCFRAGRVRGGMSMALRRGFIHALDMLLTQERASASAGWCP